MHIKSFTKIFGIAEFKTFLQKWQLLLMLLLIVTCALWCIGFSAGTRNYLEYKMKNPFIRFIPVEIPWKYADEHDYKKDLGKPENAKRFKYITPFEQVPTWYCYFKGVNGKEPDAYVRPIKPESELYNFLMTEPGILLSKNKINLSKAPWSCIVTEDYLHKLGYKGNSVDSVTYINYILPKGKEDIYVPIPVAAVVKHLPDDHAMLLTEQLFKAIRGDFFYNNPLDISNENHKKYLRLFVASDKNKLVADKLLQGNGIRNVSVSGSEETAIKGWVVTINEAANEENLRKISTVFKNYRVMQNYDFFAIAPDANADNEDISKVIIQFSSLDSIRVFQEYLQEKHKLRVNMNTVETANNFNLFDKTGRILSRVLSIFSILLIVYVITTLIREHIEKNKRNLGTLKAFGFSNTAILTLYTAISLVLILGIFMLAYLISYVVGDTFSSWLMMINTGDGDEKFSLYTQGNLSFMSFIFILIPLFFTILILFFTVRKKTPGDLIYERSNKRFTFFASKLSK